MSHSIDPEVQPTANDGTRVRFAIVCGPRTGSSYLSSLLGSHPRIVSHSELFHAEKTTLETEQPLAQEMLLRYRRADTVGFIESVYGSSYGDDVSAVGFKLLYMHARSGRERVLWDWLAGNRDIHVIHLVRRNLLAQYVSVQQARVRGQWVTTELLDETPMRFDLPPEACTTAFSTIEKNRSSMRSFFRSHPCLEVNYETLIGEKQVTHARILDFLGVPAHPLSTDLLRMNRWSLPECIANYEELKKRFAGTEWARFFEDGS